MSYTERTYRARVNRERFHYFTVKHFETDLLIGISRDAELQAAKEQAYDEVEKLRSELEGYIEKHPEFLTALSPLDLTDDMPVPIKALIQTAQKAGTGPMAGVAGLFAEMVGSGIMQQLGPAELIVENGGDIYASVKQPLTVSVFAGKSPLSEKTGILLPAGTYGVCTSSAKVGPSRNFGNADAVTIVCTSAILGDQLATGLSNNVKSPEDINSVLERALDYEEVLMILVILDDKLGVKGSLEIVPL